jgi:hypothetical protein
VGADETGTTHDQDVFLFHERIEIYYGRNHEPPRRQGREDFFIFVEFKRPDSTKEIHFICKFAIGAFIYNLMKLIFFFYEKVKDRLQSFCGRPSPLGRNAAVFDPRG